MGSNFRDWLSGGSRGRELAETRDAWNNVDRLWRRSPLSRTSLHDFVVPIIHELLAGLDRLPAWPIVVACAEATEQILSDENITELSADWSVIESDVTAAVYVRQMLARRRRWSEDFERMMGIVRRQLVLGFTALFRMLPEICFDSWGDSGDQWFEVPLISLLDEPARAVEVLLLTPYEDDILGFELFLRLRERIVTNILVASGFPPTANFDDLNGRQIMPSRQKNKNAVELADMYLAGTAFADIMQVPVPFHIPDEMRYEHCHIVGGTGHGKTQLMQRMIYADLVKSQQDGRAVVVIDSQGDLINKLVRLQLFSPDAPNSLCDRLVIIDPADVEFPAALNLFDAHLDRLSQYRPVDRERVLNGVVELYETFFGALLGAELTQKQGVIFRYLARLMLTIPGATIHTLMQLMDDGQHFTKYMGALDGAARYFFEKEFFHPSFSATKKQILKRLWGVLSTPAFERMFAQRQNKLDLFASLNEGKVILINTAKDLLKAEGSQLFGRFFIAMLAQAALERSTISERERIPTFVFVDEAQEYFDDTIETILSQARKYRVSITLAHQALDQLSPRLRAAFLSNTSLKCVGGVSSRDAHALANELHTTSDFIESMRRRKGHTEFAVWLKHRTAQALRLSVPLGFLERQPTLSEEDYDRVIEDNRTRYCGTLADVLSMSPAEPAQRVTETEKETRPKANSRNPARANVGTGAPENIPDSPDEETGSIRRSVEAREPPSPPRVQRKPHEVHELGKGGPKHRYLQTLVKELAEQQGFRATIEAPLAGGAGQIDVLLEREDIVVAVEISVTTPVHQERENIRKCLLAGYERIILVLAKSRVTQGRYRTAITEEFSDEDRARVAFASPEEIPDMIAALVPTDHSSESVVKGYKVKVLRTTVSPEEAKARRDTLSKLVARSLSQHRE